MRIARVTCGRQRGRYGLGLLAFSIVAASNAAHADFDLVRVGAKLFSDKRLSADGSISCASCHDPRMAFSDGKAIAVGVGGRTGVRNTPSLTTAALHRSFTWDGRQPTLESQVLKPLFNAREHDLSSPDALMSLVETSSEYPESFRRSVTTDLIASALAAYVRSLAASPSRFDRYLDAQG